MDNNQENLTNEILRHIQSTKRHINKFKNEVENKDIIVCMGNTRSGKSTAVNFIQGNELEAFKEGRRFYIKERDSNNNGPVISHGSISYTKIPTVWEVNDNLVVVDMPGFDDNRGVPQDIVNNIFFNQFKYAKSVRFALIADINDILSDNVGSFTDAMEKMQTIIDDFNELKDSVCVIFTKEYRNYKREDIAEILNKKIVSVSAMQVKKDLVYHLVKNPGLIGIFKMPLTEGIVTKEGVDCSVEDAIFKTQPIIINIQNIKFKTSEGAHSVLLELYQKHCHEMNFSDEIKSFVGNFENYLKISNYVFASTEEELHDTKGRLQYLLPRVTTEKARIFTNVNQLELSLYGIAGSFSQHFETKFNFLKFMDSLELLDANIKSIMISKYKNALSYLEDDINKLIKKIDGEIEDRTKETIRYILSGVVSDKGKIALMGASMIPVATKALNAIGLEVPTVTFEIVQLSSVGGCFVGAGALGVAAGGYAVHYYKTIYLRQLARKEQGRC
ncbi:hypothetical protein ILUMI_20766 [Ignelater luminosus]|uniref:G domain-containing protein n=1 Tax=Ignelater luminosus TaxID=2038154 RepID=A0A8K0G499_IGNLU|nr:hypothetical protein ILUMI_20766 [Ignelater luminosus]